MMTDIWLCTGLYFFIGGMFAAFQYNYTRNLAGTTIVFFLWPIAMLTVVVIVFVGP